MAYNESETRFYLIDPVLRAKGYGDQRWLKLERPASVEPTGPKGRRRRGPGRTDYLLCVQLDAMPAPLPVAVLEAKKESDDPLSGMQQGKGYAGGERFAIHYVFAANGHRYGEFDRFTQRQSGPFPLADFPSQAELTARYARDLGIDLSRPEAAVLFQADSPVWSRSRYYQDAAIRAALHAILRGQLNGEVVRVLLSLATGAGKTVIATNLLWRLTQAGHLTKPALFLCDRDELREQAYGKLKAAFGDNARIVRREQGTNAARNARIHIATYQTLGLDDEDGYLAACEIVQRKASIDDRVFTRAEILQAGVCDIRTGRRLTEDDLTKDEYRGRDFDDELFIELRTPAMCDDLFQLLCENGGPEQKVIVFCTREIHADRVAQRLNNLYADWCERQGRAPKEHYAFKCMGGPNKGADLIEPMRGSSERAFIACTVDLLEAGVDIEWLNAVVFFRYLQSPIKFYQMVGRGTRIHEDSGKYKFWLYDYTDVTRLFGTDFITKPPRSGGGGRGGGSRGKGGGGGGGDDEGPAVGEMRGPYVSVSGQGRFILWQRDGRAARVPVDEYRREVVARVLAEARDLDEFRSLWIEARERRRLIDHLLGEHLSPEVIREVDQLGEFDLYDVLGHYGYRARALKRPERGALFVESNRSWFEDMDERAAIVIQGFGRQFAQGGTEALETPALWEVPEIKRAGGLEALRGLGRPVEVIREAKGRLFGV